METIGRAQDVGTWGDPESERYIQKHYSKKPESWNIIILMPLR